MPGRRQAPEPIDLRMHIVATRCLAVRQTHRRHIGDRVRTTIYLTLARAAAACNSLTEETRLLSELMVLIHPINVAAV